MKTIYTIITLLTISFSVMFQSTTGHPKEDVGLVLNQVEQELVLDGPLGQIDEEIHRRIRDGVNQAIEPDYSVGEWFTGKRGYYDRHLIRRLPDGMYGVNGYVAPYTWDNLTNTWEDVEPLPDRCFDFEPWWPENERPLRQVSLSHEELILILGSRLPQDLKDKIELGFYQGPQVVRTGWYMVEDTYTSGQEWTLIHAFQYGTPEPSGNHFYNSFKTGEDVPGSISSWPWAADRWVGWIPVGRNTGMFEQ